MLTSLTPAQEAALADTREKWLRIGLSTEPADRERAEEGVRMAYLAAGLEPPRIYVWLRSPFEGVIGAHILSDLLRPPPQHERNQGMIGDQVWEQVGAQIWTQVGRQVRAQIWRQVGNQVWHQVWDEVRTHVWAQVESQVKDQVEGHIKDQAEDQVNNQVWITVGNQVWEQVWRQVWDEVRTRNLGRVGSQVRDQLEDQVNRAAFGQHDASWLSYHEFYGVHCGIEACNRLQGLNQIAASAGWWWPMQGAVVMTERPNVLKLDDEGRLHCEDGPALQYPDGWRVWCWHGMRVPQDVIEQPERITCERIRDETNVEIRRMMLDRFGIERYLRESGAAQVHQDEWGTLWRSELEGDEPLVMVEVVNSTPEPDGSFKDYFLRVPPTITTAREAVAWTFDVPAEEYAPVLES